MPLPFRLRKAPLAALVAIAMLAGCSPVPLSTVNALHAFDLATIDPASVRVALRVSDSLVFDADAPMLNVSVGLAGVPATQRNYTLTEVHEAAADAEMRGWETPGTDIRVYALDAASAAALSSYLDDIRNAPAGSRQLSLSLGLTGCAREEGRVAFASFIRLSPSEPFLVLTRERDIVTLARQAGYDVAIRACP